MSLSQFVKVAQAQKGKTYKVGASGPDAFDAPGLVNYCYQQATGKTLGTLNQIWKSGSLVKTPEVGDILCYDTVGKGKCTHVSIVISDSKMIHALNPTEGVTTRKLSDKWFQERLLGIRRLSFPVETTQPPTTQPPTTQPPTTQPPVTQPPVTPSTGFQWPAGNITTKRPGGQAYGIPWTQVSRWYDLYVQAAHEAGIDWRDLACMSVIESDANHYKTGKTTGTKSEVIIRGFDGTDDVPAVGMMQVKLDYHQWRVPDADGYSPLGNLRLAAAIIAAGIRQYGSVDQAIVKLYFPTDDINGTSQSSYINIFRSLKAELDKNGSTPVTKTDPYQVIFGGVPTRVEYGWLGDAGLSYYKYGVGHGTSSATQHTGDDVLVPYGTKLYSPGPGVVDCVGTTGTPRWDQACGAYTDTGDNPPGSKILGIGNITIMLDSGHKLTLGHCRTATVNVGQRVTQGQQVGTSGGQNGAHCHVEVSVLKNNSYWLVAPKPALTQAMSGTPVDTRPLVQFAGAKVAVPLDVPFRVVLIPSSQTRQRPGTKMTPDRYIQHETGNPNVGADAAMHLRYLQNGAPNNSGVAQSLGYHFTVDQNEIIQMIPLDEITWHGGDGAGVCNYKGVSCELCVQDNNKYKVKARENAEKLAAAVMQAMGITILERHGDCCVRIGSPAGCHINCPEYMGKENYWPTFVRNVNTYRSGSAISEPPTTYANPIAPPDWDGTDKVINGITFWALQRSYKAIEETPVYQYADVTSSQVRAPLQKGELIEGWYVVESNGELWIVTKFGSRIKLQSVTPRITITP